MTPVKLSRLAATTRVNVVELYSISLLHGATSLTVFHRLCEWLRVIEVSRRGRKIRYWGSFNLVIYSAMRRGVTDISKKKFLRR